MSKIMELADEYAKFSRVCMGHPQLPKSSRVELAAAVKAEQDYTRAVISERDALKAELEVAKADAYHCREALWKACGDDEEHVNAYLEAVKP